MRGWHASCAENYREAVEGFCGGGGGASAAFSTPPSSVIKDGFPATPPTPLNLFMNVKVEGEGGRIVFRAPTSREGDHVGFKALMDVVVVMSACPMDQRASEDWLPEPKEVQYEVLDG